jgi:phosphoribosylaminoimidazolecarboxamide formyltransferase / IMP cyclohydrolase
VPSPEIVPIRRALLSVSDKTGLIELSKALASNGVELIASGGTRKAIADAGIPVIEVSDYTGQSEILGGRVKTLHPKIHGGLLARRDVADDLATLEAQGIPPIDLVVVNLYPFRETVAKPGVTFEEVIENIDIGGPSLIRGAAKNHAHVAVLTSPDQYELVIDEIARRGGTTPMTRLHLALEVFRATAAYDDAIHDYLSQYVIDSDVKPVLPPDAVEYFPQSLGLRFSRKTELRYGENPHQRAAFYIDYPPPSVRGPFNREACGPNLATATIRHGKELSYNNLLDLDSALRLLRLFSEPTACILKHNNPCGAAQDASLADAFELAYEGDPVSAFGGIVGLNRLVDAATAERMIVAKRFIECVVAPAFDNEAFKILTTKPSWKNSVRLVELGAPINPDGPPAEGFDLRRVEGGLLVQSWDSMEPDPDAGQVSTKRQPTPDERRALAFAWRVCSSVKSNAIVLAQGTQIVGVGAGQMSRLDSVKIAIEKAGDRAKGAVLASDAFFPFRDGPDLAAAAGVTAIIQPGGSKRDDETLTACNEHGMAMILTGRRHFRH